MIIWSRLGFLVFIIAFACAIGVEAVTESWAQSDAYYQDHGWTKFLALSLAGALVWFLGRYLNDPRAVQAGSRRRGGHSFFFIAMEYWGPILVVLGLLLAL